MSSNPTIGQLLKGDEQRDAIHFAIAPVVAGQPLRGGDHVAYRSGLAWQSGAGESDAIGIADPFIKGRIHAGAKFYLFLYPNTVTGMRHQWTHPAFPDESATSPDVAKSEKWLREYAVMFNHYDADEPEKAYQNLLDDLRNGELCRHGSDMSCLDEVPDAENLRYHGSIVLGKPIDLANFSFSCGC